MVCEHSTANHIKEKIEVIIVHEMLIYANYIFWSISFFSSKYFFVFVDIYYYYFHFQAVFMFYLHTYSLTLLNYY